MKHNLEAVKPRNLTVLTPIAAATAVLVLGMSAPAFAQQQETKDENVVVVTGIRGSLQQSLSVKRNAAANVEVITAEDVGKMPDKNVADSLVAESVETEMGGLFYLINLGLFLGLYSDFTSPGRPGLALSIWDFVALIGRRLVPTEGKSDPVWGLLARLADRDEASPPGAGLEPPEEWAVPIDWLRPFPGTGDWTWVFALVPVRPLTVTVLPGWNTSRPLAASVAGV